MPKSPLYLGLIAVLASVTTLACSSSGAGVAVSCVSPSLSTTSTTVRAGEQTEVSGRWFWADCNDVMVRGAEPPPNTPIAAVRLALRTYDGQLFDLGVVHPDPGGSFTRTITVPDGAQPGLAQIKDPAGRASPAKITVHR